MILIQNLSKIIVGRPILDHVDYHFPQGERIALVGVNGAGKTTLLNILCGLEEYDEGTFIKPHQLVLGYLPQDPHPQTKPTLVQECMDGATRIRHVSAARDEALEAMSANYSDDLYHVYEKWEHQFQDLGGYELEAEAKKFLVGLGFQTSQFEQSPQVLSGGWRMRLELAKVLINQPNFLILDEPTNHLDLPSLIWLEKYLQGFKGTLLFVSHDRELLDRLSSMTLHLNRGKLTPYTGNYTKFLSQSTLVEEQKEAELKNLKVRTAQVQRFVDRFQKSASKATMVGSRQKMLEKLHDQASGIQLEPPPPTMAARFKMQRPSGKQILELRQGVIGYDDNPIMSGINLSVLRGQRIAIIGSNGIGKSTLLKTIAGSLPLLGGELEWGHNVISGYLPQNHLEELDEKETILANVIRSNKHLSDSQARSIVGQFQFRQDDAFKIVGILSGGEKSRVSLSCLVAKEANFLMLDEPTNHLDMASTDILAEALKSFEGTVLFVSHNRHFIHEVATHIFVVADKKHNRLFEGNLDDYQRAAEKQKFPNILA